jgi:kynurenine formamidase
MFRLLSYTLRPDSPTWPGSPAAAKTEPFDSIASGDVANTTVLHLFSHSGTHLDAPKHFNDAGACAFQVPIENYVFSAPLVLEVPKQDHGAISKAELEPYADQLANADLAMLRTGWSDMRDRDGVRYGSKGPFLEPDGARYLIDGFPNLKGVAIDAVSIATPDFPDEAVETHQILTGLGRADGRFLLILEDLRIDSDLGNASRIYSWPLLIEGSDGSPCTIVAEFPD